MITSIASPSEPKNAASGRLFSSGSRVIAKANSAVNTTICRIEPSAAALTTLGGTIERTKSAIPGTDAAVACGSIPASPVRSAAAAACGSGKIAISAGMTSAPKIADPVSSTANHAIDRPAIPPCRAASAPPTIPVTSSATISGMTVILSASSHSPPIAPATRTAGSRQPSPCPAAIAPTSSPMTSAPSTRHVGPIFNAGA